VQESSIPWNGMVQANSIAEINITGTANIVKPSLVFHFRRKEIKQRATKEHRERHWGIFSPWNSLSFLRGTL